jgi:hypothetical protein
VNGFSLPVIQQQPVQQALERYQALVFAVLCALLAEKSKLSRFRVII